MRRITFGIAVFNVSQFLRDCIESVTAQQGDDIQIIIVDDGSTDGSGRICDEYAARDSRIEVVHKENGGVSTARNVIFNNSDAEWICLIDGDDKLMPGAAEQIRKYSATDSDIVYFDALFFRFDKSIPSYIINMPDLIIESRKDIDMLSKATLYANSSTPDYINKTVVTAWGKAYSRSFLLDNKILFDESLRKSQDVIFNLHCMRYLKRCIMVRKAIYLYRMNEQSIVRKYNLDMGKYNTLLANAAKRMVETFDGEIKDELMKRYCGMGMLILRSMIVLDFCHRLNPKSFEERKQDFKEYLKTPWCAEVMAKCDYDMLGPSMKTLYSFISRDDFAGLCRHVRKMDMENSLRRIMSRLGLNKIKNRLRQKGVCK